MSENINMDKSIRDKLENFSAAPPPHLWNNIQGQMLAQKKKRRMAYVGWISAAAVVVAAFMAGWYFNNQSNTLIPEMVEQELTVPEQAKEVEETQNYTIQNETVRIAENQKEVSNTTIESSDKKNELINVATLYTAETEIVAANETKRESFRLLKRIEAAMDWSLAQLDLVETENEVEMDLLSANDEIKIAENLKHIDSEKTERNGWIVGAHVAPGYSSHSANHNDTYASNMRSSSSDGNSNVGAGFSVQYKTGKRFKVESGLYYAQNGHKANNSPGLFSFRNGAAYDAAPEFSGIDDSPAYSNAVRLSSNGIAMNSTAGVINMRNTPKGAEITSNLETLDGKSANTIIADGEFSQVFEFVEVPLYLRYSVLDKKFGIELLGGLNAGIVVGNNAYIENQYGLQNIGSTEDISKVNLSGTVGVGVNYMLGKHFSLALEPRLNYYLNSINTSSDVDFRPYRVGLYTGIYYEF